MKLFARAFQVRLVWGILLTITFFLSPLINPAAHANGELRHGDASDKAHFTDQCIGGTAHELVAQANIVTARKYPEYGLSEDLAVSCPRFVWVVLQADSLPASDKKRVFADVMTWGPDQKIKFFLPLKEEVDRASDTYWKQNTKAN